MTGAAPDAMSRRLLRNTDDLPRAWAVFTLGYIAFGMVSAAQVVVQGGSADVALWRPMAFVAGHAMAHALLVPAVGGVVAATAAVPRLAAQVMAHLVAVTVYAAAIAAQVVVLDRLLFPGIAPASFVHDWTVAFLVRSVSEALHYGVAVVAWYAFVYDRHVQATAIRTAALARQLAETELRALRTQLEPHFLSNALNAIVAFIRDQPDVAEGMLGRLDRFLRHVLDASHTQRVPLRDELRLVDEYLAIHRVRFGDRLEVAVDVADDVAAARVPVLIFQPLVENAIVHGVGTREGPGFVHIRASRHGGEVRTTIEDGGTPGGEPSLPPTTLRPRGIGLANTERRLTSLYGTAWTLTMQRTSRGTLVTISFPFDPAD